MDLEDRVATLEAALNDFALRYSALEWIVEQHFTHYLVDVEDAEADALLAHIKHPIAPTFQATAEGDSSVPYESAVVLEQYREHIVGKIEARLANRRSRR